MKVRNIARRALFDTAVVASIALVVLAMFAYLRTDEAPQLAKGGRGLPTYISAANGRVQLFNDRDHETILSDGFVADPTVVPPITSDRKFSAPGLRYRSIQWGDSDKWGLSIAAPVLLVLPAGLGIGVVAIRRRRKNSTLSTPPTAESTS